jgi:hypothetical protein
MAEPKVGQITSYDVVENIIDFSDILNEKQMPSTPLLNKIGILNEPVYSTTYQWYDEAFPILNTAVKTAYVAATANGVLIVDSTVGIMVNSVIKVDDVLYRVTAVNSDTELAVTPVAGLDADHDSGAVVTIVSNSALEGADYEDGHYNPLIERFNFTQIFKDYVKITGTQDAVRRKVRGALLAQEIDSKMRRLRVMLERAAWLGIRSKPSVNDAPRLMGGIDWFITNEDGIVVTPDTMADFEATFKEFLRLIYDVRGSVNEAWMNPVTMEHFLALGEDALIIDQYSEQAGRNVRVYMSQYGETALNMSPDIPPDVIYVVDTSNIKIRPLVNRQFQFEELAKTGDSTKGQLIGEYTLEFNNPDLAGKLVIPSV